MSASGGDERLGSFERGEAIAVPLDKIELELSALWRQAARRAQDGGGQLRHVAVTRACLWNLVVRVEASTAQPGGGEVDFAAAKQMVDEISPSVPARVVVTQVGSGEEPLSASIEVNWHDGDAGRMHIGSDEVTLRAGAKAAGRMTALVRSLLHADAPTALLLFGPPQLGSAQVRELLPEVGRLIVDTRRLSDESGLKELAALAKARPELEIADLSWLGVSPLRGLCAGLFDLDPTPLERLDRVRVVTAVSGTQARALLTLGWLGSCLGWSAYKRAPQSGSLRAWKAQRRGGGEVQVELETRVAQNGHGVAELGLYAGALAWSLKRENLRIDVHSPDLPPRIQPARRHSFADLVVSSLGARGRDAMFAGALGHAAALVGAP